MKKETISNANATKTTQEVIMDKVVFNVTSIFIGTKDLKAILTERVIEKALSTAKI